MLSKKSIMMLKWFRENDKWIYCAQLERLYPAYEERSFTALRENGFMDIFVDESDFPDNEEWEAPHYPEQCRINDKGRAHLEERRAAQFDTWITRSLAIAALVISLIALLSQLGILQLR